MRRPWLPLYVGLANLALNAVLDWILLKPFGAAGIALLTSLVPLFTTVILVSLLRGQLGGSEARRIAFAAGKALLCGVALAAVAAALWYILRGVAEGGFAQAHAVLALPVAASGLVYVFAARLLHVEELSVVWALVRRRLTCGRARTPSSAGRV